MGPLCVETTDRNLRWCHVSEKEAHLMRGELCQVERANWLDSVEHRTFLKTDIPRQTDQPQGWPLSKGS